jgi:ATP-dependent helicase HrpA
MLVGHDAELRMSHAQSCSTYFRHNRIVSSASSFKIHFPEELPVSARRDEIARAISEHQIVIVCGETGSGKTTQLPKICLQLGRGAMHTKPGQKPQLIGHTQPRRIAASTVAKRIAQELNMPLGEVVGYKVRFADKLSKGASVKLMTDGILLAETQTDPLLKAYDTLIIDEAHERSLNIDFLLGYLRQLLPRRPDLKIIITSATIDADRFAEHFASTKGPAPVIMVSGRTYAVEQRYRPFEESRDFDANDAIEQAVDELWPGSPRGDILVFLPGEREIREAADHLRKACVKKPGRQSVDVLPLFARLSQAEQERIFEPDGRPRIVLATNVAETSLTVPGIRYVIDAGTARVKRYSFRNKVEQLLIEPVSQAAANQRAGRCGRVAEGICIRLYDEKDFAGRPRFTDPEILRSSLASVILRMKSLHLGMVEEFPFIDAPSKRAIADGYQLLQELGAVDEGNELTKLGAELAKLPLDPRVGRMILEAKSRAALSEVLVIASALSLQDVRDRPLDMQQKADEAHKKFDDERSEFVGYLKLWKWLDDVRGSGDQKSSNRQWEQQLRSSFVNIRRVREWRDIYSQLLSTVQELGFKPNAQPASFEQLHLSLLSGLLGNIGYKQDEEDAWLGARGIKWLPHPGANLSKKPGRWIVCAELVETARLYGRGVAGIEPKWIEQVAEHLLQKQLLEPHFDKRSGDVLAYERASLYGLLIYSGRRVNFSRVDPHAAREIFIREALVAGCTGDIKDAWECKLPFYAHNQRMVRQVEELEHKSRRQDVLVDEELIFAFYDAALPADVCNARELEAWVRAHHGANPKLLYISKDELMRHEASGITSQAFPKLIRLGGVDCKATYLHDPGDAKDGLTVELPLFALNQVNEERCEWLVHGMLQTKVQALIKSLPQRPRSRLVPLPESAARLAEVLNVPEAFGKGSLVDALLKLCKEATSVDIKRTDFKLDMLPIHLFMNFRVVDEHGRQLAQGRNLAAIKAELGSQARGAFAALAQISQSSALAQLSQTASTPSQAEQLKPNQPSAFIESSQNATKSVAPPAPVPNTPAFDADARYTDWSFGELPELLEIRRKLGKDVQTLIGFPALIDQTESVSIEVFDEPSVAAQKHQAGLRRLVALQIKDALKYLEKNIPDLQKMGIAYLPLGTSEELKAQILDLAIDKAFLTEPLPTTAQEFKARVAEGRGRLTLICNEVARLANLILTEYQTALRKIKDSKNAPDATADATAQLQRLMPRKFLSTTPYVRLQHFARYLKAIQLRLDKYRADPARDALRMKELRPEEQRFLRLLAERKGVLDERLEDLRWLFEELRVSFFAQELRTPQPVSIKRIQKSFEQLAL